MKGVRFAATTTTTALGNVASEIAGRCDHVCFIAKSGYRDDELVSSVLQPNSPQAMVVTALESGTKTKLVRIPYAVNITPVTVV